MTRWLALRKPDASPALQLACRAQHFRRWELPRSSYPMTRAGYLTWRSKQKSVAASQVAELLASSEAIQPPLPKEEIDRVAALVRKENLKNDEETQILEDVACLVFLDDQFDDFESKPEIDQDKIVGILRKTWGKMSAPYKTHGRSFPLPPACQSSPQLQHPKMTLSKPPLSSLLSTHDFHQLSLTTLPPKPLAFLTSTATDSHTHRSNTTTYSLLLLRPRILIPVHKPISLCTTLLSSSFLCSSPIYASATSLGKLFHPRGELEIAEACSNLNIAQVISTSASFTLEEICSVGNHAKHFQLYMDKDRENSKKLLKSLQGLGVKSVWLTVDAPVMGKREADERVPVAEEDKEKVLAPMGGTSCITEGEEGALGRVMGSYVDASTCWDDIKWVREQVGEEVKIVLKGVQTGADAKKAMREGVDGIVLSNHGGRSLDTSTATILLLLELQKNCPEVFDKMEVMIDGGVMRGTDVFKALCLGAKGVGIGRGVLCGLAGYGRDGVSRYFEILSKELETSMRMCGVTSLDELHPGFVNTRAVDHLIPDGLGDDHPYAKWKRGGKSKL
ncbi:cytochrome b2 [Podospora fimiseda]|uniref:Cytochrome b2 n=1 Tax=Podospora fimiseda TaxID=252190 RepID=A0AAN7BIM2_9PEZI|nr:cytochrome b2 [Podospora fimiseda]